MNVKEIIEGSTKLLVPVEKEPTKKSEVFFNPAMEMSRDLSVTIAKVVKPKKFCDSLAGSGARGIRIANEVKCQVLLNDVNSKAIGLIEKNKELNKLSKVDIRHEDANSLLTNENFDWVDVDPFGSPVKFLDSAVRAVSHNGILVVTATDTAPLSGTYPKSCLRKYSALPLRTDYYNELGVRIFLGCIARTAAKYDKSLQILFSHCTRHYYRVYAKVKKSRKETNSSLAKMKFLQHCFRCLNREVKGLNELKEKCSCGEKFHNAGPIFSGKFADMAFCRKLYRILEKESFKLKNQEMKLVKTIGEEQIVTIPYYDIHKVFKKGKLPVKSMEEIANKLKNNGFLFSRTHFSPIGLRTDAKVSEIYQILKD